MFAIVYSALALSALQFAIDGRKQNLNLLSTTSKGQATFSPCAFTSSMSFLPKELVMNCEKFAVMTISKLVSWGILSPTGSVLLVEENICMYVVIPILVMSAMDMAATLFLTMVHSISPLSRCGAGVNLLWRTFVDAVQTLTVPFLLLLPFSLASRFHVENSFFSNGHFLHIPEEVIAVAVYILIVAGLPGSLICRRTKSAMSPSLADCGQFRPYASVAEFTACVFSLVLGLHLYSHMLYPLLLFGAIALFSTLLFAMKEHETELQMQMALKVTQMRAANHSAYTSTSASSSPFSFTFMTVHAGRILFFATVLLGELQLRSTSTRHAIFH